MFSAIGRRIPVYSAAQAPTKGQVESTSHVKTWHKIWTIFPLRMEQYV